MERDDKTTLKGVVGKDFNSHAHVERDLKSCNVATILRYFNSHAHVERDEVQMSFTEMQVKFQLTRSRGA